MTRDGSRRRPAPLLGLAVALGCLAALALPAAAQALDCPALRAQIDAAGQPGDPGRYALALRQQREDIARTRAYADQSGCGDGVFDDPDAPECRALARRLVALQAGLQRLEDQASRANDGGADDRRRALLETYNAECGPEPTETDPAALTVPVDPDAPAAGDAPPGPAPAQTPAAPVVLCVRHCDGAYYPLAVDIRPDRMADMDRICQAQCPAATASAYAGQNADDVADARSTDGSRYGDLAAAFLFRKGPSAACACRRPNQSWAETLAGAEAMLEPHKGDVTVTPALAEAMSRPAPAPAPARATPVPRKPARRAAPPALPAPAAPEPPDSAQDLTRAFRRSVPTL